MTESLYTEISPFELSLGHTLVVHIEDQIRTYPLYLFRKSELVKGKVNFLQTRGEENDSKEYVLDLTGSWSYAIFCIIVDHMQIQTEEEHMRHTSSVSFIRNRIFMSNVREVEQLADFLLYEPLRVILVDLTIQICDRSVVITFHNHQWMGRLLDGFTLKSNTEQCFLEALQVARELKLSVAQIRSTAYTIYDHNPSGWCVDESIEWLRWIDVTLLNDGMMSLPSLCGLRFSNDDRLNSGMLIVHTRSGIECQCVCEGESECRQSSSPHTPLKTHWLSNLLEKNGGVIPENDDRVRIVHASHFHSNLRVNGLKESE